MSFDLSRISRRKLLSAALGLPAVLFFARPALFGSASPEEKQLMWVWQFSSEGEPNVIGRRLLDHRLGIVLKTHDGPRWMAQFDTSEYAVANSGQVRLLAQYFEDAGIPFHAWAVVTGTDPRQEAIMAAEVLASGARSLYLDLAAGSDIWQGDGDAALRFADDLLHMGPPGKLILVADARPWLNDTVPLSTIEPVCHEVAVKALWTTYDHHDQAAYAELGFPVPDEGISPEFVYAIATSNLAWTDLPRSWIADGSDDDPGALNRFLGVVRNAGEGPGTIWRYGITPDEALAGATLPPDAELRQATEYIVGPGDTLSGIAAAHDVSVDDIVGANGLDNPDWIREGQVLLIPAQGRP